MIDDDVPLATLKRAAQAAYMWIIKPETYTADVAQRFVDGDTKAAGGGADPKAGTTTGEAPTTQKRAPGTTTKYRPKSTKGSAAKGK